MRIIIILVFAIISYASISQEKMIVNNDIFGKWKTISFTSKNEYYHNFENDSMKVFDVNYFTGKNKSDSLFFLQMLKDHSQENKISYQFNTDSTCIVKDFDGKDHKYTFSFDALTKAVTFKLINPKTQKPDSFYWKLDYIDNQTITLRGGGADDNEFIRRFKKVN